MTLWLDALLGKLFNNGIALELSGGLDFLAPLGARINAVTKRVEVFAASFEFTSTGNAAYTRGYELVDLEELAVADAAAVSFPIAIPANTHAWVSVLVHGVAVGGTGFVELHRLFVRAGASSISGITDTPLAAYSGGTEVEEVGTDMALDFTSTDLNVNVGVTNGSGVVQNIKMVGGVESWVPPVTPT